MASKSRLLLLVALTAGLLVSGASAAKSGKTIYRDKVGDAPSKAPDIKFASVSDTAKGWVTVAVHLANRPTRNTMRGDDISIGLDADADRATGSSTGVDYVLEYRNKTGAKHPSTWVARWSKGHYVTDAAFRPYFGHTLKVLSYGKKGTYLAWSFSRKLFSVGRSFKFWVGTEYGCKNGKSCHPGDYLPSAASPGVLAYRVKHH